MSSELFSTKPATQQEIYLAMIQEQKDKQAIEFEKEQREEKLRKIKAQEQQTNNNCFEYIISDELEPEQWLLERQKVITSTQALFTMQNFSTNEKIKALANQIDDFKKTKNVFYLEKHLPIDMLKIYNDLHDSEAKRSGIKLEPKVAEIGFELLKQQNQDYNNATIICNQKTMWSIKNKPVSATPDYVITKSDGIKELLECKTTRIEFDTEQYNNLIQKYQIQCQHQLLCSGLRTCWLVMSYVNDTRDEILDTRIIKVEANTKLQNEILSCCEKCVEWIQNVEKGIEKLEEKDYQTEDEKILNNLVNNNLQAYLQEYGEAILMEQSRKEHLDKVKEIVSLICKNDIKVDGWDVKFKKQEASIYTIEMIEKQIKANEKKNFELNEKLQLLKDNPNTKLLYRQGFIKDIKISKVDNGCLNG